MKQPCHLNPNTEAMLSAYSDGQLPEKETARVRRHLESCASCRKLVADIARMRRLMQDVGEVEPSPEFDRNFWRKVQLLGPSHSRKPWFQWPDFGFRPAWAALAAASLVLAMGLALHFGQGNTPKTAGLDAASLQIAEDMELYEELDMIRHLDLLENWDAVHEMENT